MTRLSYASPGVYSELMPSLRQPIFGVGTNTAAFIGLVPDAIWVPVANPDYDPVLTRQLEQANEALQAGETPEKLRSRLSELTSKKDDRAAQLANRVAAKNRADQAKDEAGNALQNANARRRPAAEASVAAAAQAQAAAEAAVALAQRDLDIISSKVQDLERRIAAVAPPAGPAAPAAAPAPARDEPAAPGVELAAPVDGAPVAGEAAPAEPATGGGAAPAGGAAAPAAGSPQPGPAIEVEDVSYADDDPPPEFQQPSPLRPYYFVKKPVKAAPMATKLCTNFSEYVALFGEFSGYKSDPENPNDQPESWRFAPLHPGHHMLTHAAYGFFQNGGQRLFVSRIPRLAQLDDLMERLESIDEVALLAAPGLPKTATVWEALESYCENEDHLNVFAVLDSSEVINDGTSSELDIESLQYQSAGDDSDLPRKCPNAAYYFPHIEVSCPAKVLQDSDPARKVPAKYAGLTYVAPSGHVVGVYARTDEERGVFKAPANAVVRGALGVKYYVSKPKQELLNPQGVNCIRTLNGAITIWGARTIGGEKNFDLMYVNVVRFIGFLQKSIEEGTQWAVFEPNDNKLWGRIILNITSFLTNVWRGGALFGLTQQEAFYVRCDEELNPPSIRDLGQVVTEIGVAIVRPAEFVIFRIAQFSAERGN